MEASPVEPWGVQQPAGIGERLRAERQRSGLTVREIARRVGVSPSLISQIEREKVNPSVSTLWSLVGVLGLQMSDLFGAGEASPGGPPASGPPGPGRATGPGARAVIELASGVRWERLTATSDPVVEFLGVTYPPGSASCDAESLVRHGGREYGYVVDGRLGVRVGLDEYELGPGTAISFDASAPHRLWAIGDRPAEAIWVVVGRRGGDRGRRPWRALDAGAAGP